MKVLLPNMTHISGGTFWMGGNPPLYDSESPRHKVTIKSFALGIFPVTRSEFQCTVASKSAPVESLTVTKSEVSRSDHPMSGVSWDEAVAYCRWLSRVTGHRFRLPTEAEWEYAAKAAQDLQYPTASGDLSSDVATYDDRGGACTPVGIHPPNPFGLYDMAGNVWEWCSSKKGDYSGNLCTKSYNYPYNRRGGRESLDGHSSRVLRGGCYTSAPIHCRSAARYREFQHRNGNRHSSGRRNVFGFRIAADKLRE